MKSRSAKTTPFKRTVAALTAAALLFGLSPARQVLASGVLAQAGTVRVTPTAVGAAGLAVTAAAIGAQGLGTLDHFNPSLSGSLMALPSITVAPQGRGIRESTLPGIMPLAASAVSGPQLLPALTALPAPAARPVLAAIEAARSMPGKKAAARRTGLQVLNTTGARLKQNAKGSFGILHELFSGRRGGAGEAAAVVSGRFGQSHSDGLRPAADGIKRAERRGEVPAAHNNSSTARETAPWYKNARLWKWLGGAVLAVGGLLAAPSLGYAAGEVLAPGLAKIGFGTAMEWLAQAGYFAANGIGFIYMLPQVHKIIRDRSGTIAAGTVATGTIASGILAFNAAFAGKGLWAFQNLMGSLSFAASIALIWMFGRKGKGAAQPAGKRRLADAGRAVGVFVVLSGLAMLGSKLLVGVVPALSFAGALILPLQLVAALGFAFLFMPQYIKMEMEKHPGHVSKWTTLSFIAATIGISFWALWQAAALASGPVLSNLLVLGAFMAAVMVPSHFVLRGIARIPWQQLPESVSIGKIKFSREAAINALSLLLLAADMAAVLAIGVVALNIPLNIEAASVNQFWMFLLYVVENVFAALVSLYSLSASKRYAAPAKN